MKKFTFRTLLAVAAASVLLTACKDENDDGNTSKTTYEFSVKAEDNPIDAPADGKTYTILVTSTKTAQAGTSAVAYEVVSSPEWAPAELEQTALVITVAKNSSTEAREPGKVVLKQDESDKTLEITVNQAGFSNSMSLEAAYSTDRCKVLLIEPAITGFDQNPVYEWTVKGPGDAEAAEKGDALLQAYSGAYVIESFNPAAVNWYKENRPEVCRGQLSWWPQGEEKPSDPAALAKEYAAGALIFDWISRPDFVAYDWHGGNSPQVRLARFMGAVPVSWTVRSRDELAQCDDWFDHHIFEAFVPDEQ